MKINQPYLRLFIIISLFAISFPKKTKILYSLTIDKETPILSRDHIFYLKNSAIKALDRDYRSYDMFDNSYRKPLLNKWTKWGYTNFFTKDCRLEMWEDKGKDTLRGHKIFDKTFNELKGDYCYDSLDMFYDDNRKDVAVYNTRYKRITVFNLKDIKNDDVVGKVKLDSNIKQALIYNYDKDVSILIGIDASHINFYNLRGSYSWRDWFVDFRLIESIKINNNYIQSPQGKKIAGIMEVNNNKDKLLYIDWYNVYLYNLKKFKSISSLFIAKPSTVLTTKIGNAFIGNEYGSIFLITYNNGKLSILKEYNVCDGVILDISCDDSVNYLLVQCEDQKRIYLKHISLGDI